MLIFPFNTDVKFTVVPVMGGMDIPREEMIELQVKIENLNRGVSFEPVWSWNAAGVEIEIERDKIKFATTYFVVLSWKKPDTAFNDGYKDIRGVRACIAFVEGWCAGQCEQDGQVIELVVSPEFKGEKGDPFRFEDFTQEQLDDLQRPAIEAAETANQAAQTATTAAGEAVTIASNAATAAVNLATTAAGEAVTIASNAATAAVNLATTAAGEADTATQSANTATSAANTAAETANTAAANVKDGYTPEIGENENWFVNDVDTGKPSRGRIGETIYNVATGTPLRVWLSDTLPEQKETDIIYIGYE